MAAEPARVLDPNNEPNPPEAEALYENPPEGYEAEILHGIVLMAPSPRVRHQRVALRTAALVDGPFDRGHGGPGGWVFVPEPRLELGIRPDRLRPDVAGWKRARMPQLPDVSTLTMAPDWVCEVLSPRTEVADRGLKAPIYAEHGVQWLWFVDPTQKLVEAFKLSEGALRPIGVFRELPSARIPPFDELELPISELWAL